MAGRIQSFLSKIGLEDSLYSLYKRIQRFQYMVAETGYEASWPAILAATAQKTSARAPSSAASPSNGIVKVLIGALVYLGGLGIASAQGPADPVATGMIGGLLFSSVGILLIVTVLVALISYGRHRKMMSNFRAVTPPPVLAPVSEPRLSGKPAAPVRRFLSKGGRAKPSADHFYRRAFPAAI